MEASTEPTQSKAYDLTNLRRVTGERMSWKVENGHRFTALNLLEPAELMFAGEGWGQRDPFNKDQGATLPYVVRHQEGAGMKRFASVFCTDAFVKSAKRAISNDSVVVTVETEDGTDTITCGRGFSVKSKDWSFEHGE
ncbi:MAG TPA: hypothetical protein VF669_10760, partial [Tepidisphaeraceae bacterium]|jgi:hypothetical protein